MKKYFLTILAVVAFLIIYVPAQAQTYSGTTTGQATVSATVRTSLSVSKISDVNFGGIVAGQTATLNPDGTTANTNVGSAASLGEFSITGSDTASVVVEIPKNLSLYLGGGTSGSSINYSTSAFGSETNSQSGTNAGTISTGTANITLGTPAMAGSPNYYIWIGGSVNPASGTSAGTYSNTLTVTVYYQ